MTVYFAQAGVGGRVKIGHTYNIAKRIASIAPGCPFPLILLRELEGNKIDEAWLHHRFAAYRRHREWFDFCDEMLTIELPDVSSLCRDLAKNPVGAMRMALGMSQCHFSTLVDVGQGSINQWELGKGKPPQAVLARIRTKVGEYVRQSRLDEDAAA